MHDEREDRTPDSTDHESMTRSAEEISRVEKEPGRRVAGEAGESRRPTGTSTARDYTGIDPQDPPGGSPAG